MRALRARAALLKLLVARKASKNGRGQGHEKRKQLRAESRLECFFRMGAALTISLGAGTGLHFEDTRQQHTVSHYATARPWSASLQHPLVSLSTTREVCAVAGAQDVVRDHVELFGMLLYIYSEGV